MRIFNLLAGYFRVLMLVLVIGLATTHGYCTIQKGEARILFQENDSGQIDTLKYRLQKLAKANYSITKASAQTSRLSFQMEYVVATTDSARACVLSSAGKSMETSLINEVFPFWYGTPWTFEGHTNVPNQGTVACGYFVSTTLKHIGVNVNRYHLAQQNPENEAKTVACGAAVYFFQDVSVPQLHDTLLRTFEDGLYFIGLDNHVGYMLKRMDEVFFIHSNYVGSGGVTVERILWSTAFPSTTYWIAPISNNHSLVEKWVSGEEVIVVR